MKICILLWVLWYLSPATATPQPQKMPDLQHLTRPADTVKTDSTRITTLDSARFIAPPLRSLLSGGKTVIQILPRCPADSIILFVRHSFDKTDTLCRLYRPPYRTEWDFSALPDQDQVHLQFGYRIFHPNGNIITSKPLPHQWTIDRSRHRSRKVCHARQITPPDTVIIDGKIDEWKKARRKRIGSAGQFAFMWTSAYLYFMAEINTPAVSPSDIIEVHLDPYQTRGSFTDERHRSIRFGPQSRSFCIAACRNDSLYMQCDSIVALLNEGLAWRVKTGASGYTLEAAIPFYALSDREFPQLRFGCDVTVRTGTGKSATFTSWAGSGEYNRYNPGGWGTVVLHQAMLPLKIFISASGVFIVLLCIVIVILVVRNLFASERSDREEHRGGSQQLQSITTCIDDLLSDCNLSIDTVAQNCRIPRETIATVLQSELECTITDFIRFRRISAARKLLWNFSLPINEVAHRCGFIDVAEFKKSFEMLHHTDPESFREKIREESADDTSQEDQIKPVS